MLWNLPGGLLWICMNKFNVKKKYSALLPYSFLWLGENYNILAAEDLNLKFREVEARFLKGRLH